MNRIVRIRRTAAWAFAVIATVSVLQAGPLTYVVNGSQQFGTVDVSTGAFQQIGPTGVEAGYFGLAPAPGGQLVTLSYSSDLFSINPATGVQTLIGPTGLADCTTPASPCGPTSNASLGGVNGNIYATDFDNKIYRVNAVTGAATLIGSTGIAAIPFIPGSVNPDGTLNFYDEAIFGADGNLYETFDCLVFDPITLSAVSVPVAPALYRIDLSTGLATRIGATDLGIGGVAEAEGVVYAFNDVLGQVSHLNLTDGRTTMVGSFDPAAGVVQGAVATTPEPNAFLLALAGFSVAGLLLRRQIA